VPHPEPDRAGDPGEPARRGVRMTRRQALGVGASTVGAGLLAAYGIDRIGGAGVGGSGGRADIVLRAAPATFDLAGRPIETWAYDGRLPGRELRIRQGQRIRIRVDNELDDDTSVHWHGLRVSSDMDGVPDLTQDPIGPGGSFVYEIAPPDPGTYMYHSHVGMQLDRGLYGPLIVEPRREELDYDREAVLVLDDWIDGVAGSPDDALDRLRDAGMGGMQGMGGMRGMEGTMGGGMGAPDGAGRLASGPHTTLRGARPSADDLAGLANALEGARLDGGDVRHPLYLINGRPPVDPPSVRLRRGQRLRLRVLNPAADTLFCFFVEGHELTVTHADGQPVTERKTDGLVVGPGERYDVLLDGRRSEPRRIVAKPLGKAGRAVAILRFEDARRSRARPPDAPLRMPTRIASYADLRDAEPAERLGPARGVRLDLGAGHGSYSWTIGGQAFPDADPVRLRRGEDVRFTMANRTMMPHPMHLHGHFFRLADEPAGARKDTIVVPPMRQLAVDFRADNPGSWAFHCHNAYHAEAGMMRAVEVA
jgi:multicopper oxidase